MEYRAFTLTCFDGHQMPVYEWEPAGEPKAVIHIIHGLWEHALRYAPPAETLVQKGFAVYAHDNRGHGAATTVLGEAGKNFFYNQVEDIRTLVHYYRERYPGKKIFLLGHSMGSLIAQRYFQLYGKEINGLILSGTNGKPDPLLPIVMAIEWLQMKRYGGGYRSKIFYRLLNAKYNRPFKPLRTQYDWLSRDEQEVDKALADPKMGFNCTASFYYDLLTGTRDIFKKKNILDIPNDIPVYAFSGDEDPAGLMGKGFMQLIANWKAAGIKDLEYKLYAGGRHEMMNELNRKEVLNDLSEWLEKHL
jgi:alpha-beta hydrolase superfamily lysophospholipase